MPDSDTAKPGIIVLGFPRSGTTLLRRMLDGHPQIACSGETFLLKGAARFLQSEELAHGASFGVLGGLTAIGYDEEEILDRVRDFVTGFFEEIAEKAGKPRWAVKTAVDTFYLEEIEQLFGGGKARFVCIVRHGLDVVASLKKFTEDRNMFMEEIHDYVRDYPHMLEAFAHAWADVTADLLDFVEENGKNAILIKYEDLVRMPEETLGTVMDFLGEEWEDAMLDTAFAGRVDGLGDWKAYSKSEMDESRIHKWADALPQAEVDALSEIVNEALERCGYPPVTGADDEDARRKEELARMLMSAGRAGGDSQ